MTRSPRPSLVFILVALLSAAVPSFGQTPPAATPAPEGTVEKARAWSDAADLSVVITTGNSEGTNIALSTHAR
jgi:hypothetical protein